MKYKEPLVSIIIPCFNQENFLSETLNSVKNQIYQNWECIIVDDGSTDNSKVIAQKYTSEDNRFSYSYKLNEGVSVARNFGIAHSQGAFILPLDADDKISTSYMVEAINTFNEYPKIKLVSSKAYFFGNRSGAWELKEYNFRDLLFGNMLHCSGIFKREDYNHTSGYRTNMKYGLEDWDFWLSLLNPNDKIIILPKFHLYYRINTVSRTSSLLEDRRRYKKMKRQVFANNISKYYISSTMLPNSLVYFLNKQIYQIQKKIRPLLVHNKTLDKPFTKTNNYIKSKALSYKSKLSNSIPFIFFPIK